MIRSIWQSLFAKQNARRRSIKPRILKAWERLEERAVLANSAVELSVVFEATSVDSAGEADVVPDDLVYVHEWQEFFVEVWVSTPLGIAQDVDAAMVELAFDPEQLDLIDVVSGAGFTLAPAPDSAQLLTASNTNGSVTLDATAAFAELGDDSAALVARLAFRADGVDIDRLVRSIGPADMALSIVAAEVELTPGVAETAFSPADPLTEIWAVPYNRTDSDFIGFGELALLSEFFFLPVTTNSPAMTWLSDFDKSGFVGFGDLAIFSQSFGLPKPSSRIAFHESYPDA